MKKIVFITLFFSLSAHALDCKSASKPEILKLLHSAYDEFIQTPKPGDKVEVKNLGLLHNKSGAFCIIHYIWHWKSAGGSQRHTPRLVILNEQMRYLGQYSHLDSTPEKVEGNKIIFETKPEFHNGENIVEFKDKTPPQYIVVNGSDASFDKSRTTRDP